MGADGVVCPAIGVQATGEKPALARRYAIVRPVASSASSMAGRRRERPNRFSGSTEHAANPVCK
jgi:hypothetical protein